MFNLNIIIYLIVVFMFAYLINLNSCLYGSCFHWPVYVFWIFYCFCIALWCFSTIGPILTSSWTRLFCINLNGPDDFLFHIIIKHKMIFKNCVISSVLHNITLLNVFHWEFWYSFYLISCTMLCQWTQSQLLLLQSFVLCDRSHIMK